MDGPADQIALADLVELGLDGQRNSPPGAVFRNMRETESLEGRPRMRRSAVLATAAVLALLALAPTSAAARSSGGPYITQAYYLFYSHDLAIHANCLGPNRYIAYRGIVRLSPYRHYKVVRDGSATNGIFQTSYYLIDGFSTAVRDLYCRNGDFVYEYFGDHKVQQKETYVEVCYGMSCQTLDWFYTPWRSRNWM